MLAGETKPGIMAREFFEIKKLFEVPGKAFSPAPKTLSAVLLLRPRKEKTLFALVLQQQKMMVKNAIMRALFLRQKTTKNEARKALKTLKLNNKLAEKRVRELNSNELLAVREVL
jgi:16S rRNA A1518/A1519 N6-dimethyltransferase RsmA/KsgA/DIM1 with predicted DNA glycosylase/AP lyase activity